MRKARALVFVAVAGLSARASAACFIDLDPVGAAPDDAAVDANDASPAQPDAADVVVDRADSGVECASDPDCIPSGLGAGCLTKKRCASGKCVYEACPPSTKGGCTVGVCDFEGGAAGACGDYEPAFLAGSFSVSTNQLFTNLPCATLGRCVAAAYPFVFVVDGFDTVSGYFVADPTDKTPRRVAVDKLGAAPGAIVASGNRVFFVSKPQGTADLVISIGWFDLPANPFAATIPVNRVELPYRTTNTSLPTLMAAPDSGAYLVLGTTVYLFRPPVAAGADVRYVTASVDTQIPVTLVAPAGGDIAASALDAATGATAFSLLKNAGTLASGFSPRAGVDTSGSIGTVAGGQLSVAGGADDEVVAAAGIGALVDGSIPQVQRARLVWVVDAKKGAVADNPDAGIDLMTYAPPFASNVRVTTGPAAIDGGAIAVYVNQQRDASVAQLVERSGAGGGPEADPLRIANLPGGQPQSYFLQASSDWVYAFSAAGTTLTVHILRPACLAQ